ncbi:hypothetical protein [Aquimarina litoralis]|uniref:hypothetical protein n=1 Tax=Aquimarina litoralis TaxID=584605 RepID=UPI001C5A5218|nr:hypothetical protein [Aquimarina litoralis]MBW1294965.1 hypothetical protein [Aquimarina litoralis]
MRTLLIKLLLLVIATVSELAAQVAIPNGDFNQFETIYSQDQEYEIPVGWREHPRNEEWRQSYGEVFAYKYELPDANKNALALHRGYLAQSNEILTSFLVPAHMEDLQLIGRYKFSGSDIDRAEDVLRIIVISSEKVIHMISDTHLEDANILNITTPKAQFNRFHLDIDKIQKNTYVTIVIQLISGSDDSFYWGQSNAVLDDLKFVFNHRITSIH